MTHNLDFSKVCKKLPTVLICLKSTKLPLLFTCLKSSKYKKKFFVHSIKMVNLSLNELKLIAKFSGIKGYKSVSEDKPESLKESGKNFDDTRPKISFSKSRIEEIRKIFNESRHKFFKSKIKMVRRNLYEIENAKILSASNIKEIEKKFLKLEKNLSKSKKYYDYGDVEYRGIRGVKDLFDLSTDEEINYIFSKKDSDETRTMSTKSNNIEVMMGSETDEVIEDLLKFLLQRYQEKLKESIRGIDFIFDIVDTMYYDLHQISLNRGGTYIDSPKWLKNKKATINPKNKDDRCLQYLVTIALNYQKIKSNPESI